MRDYIQRQHDLRQAAWHEAKTILDTAANEGRDLTAEEQQTYDRISEDLDTRAAVIEQLKKDEERAARLDAAAAEIRTDETPAGDDGDAEMIRALAKGEIRSFEFTKRDLDKTTASGIVPTSFYDQVQMKAQMIGPMLDPSIVTVMNTAGGENMTIPRLTAYSAGTLFAEGSAIGESDPTISSVTLGAYKYGFIVQLARELIEDSGVDILGFLAKEVGTGLGYSVNTALTTGTGSSQPNGIVTAAGTGITGSTAVSGVFTADNLIDLFYSLDGAARMLPGVGWMMNGASIGAVRKLKDTAGNYVFSPAASADQRDLLLGRPVFENPTMASTGTANKSVLCGHFPSYFVRSVGGIRLDRSDDWAFTNDLVTFRATCRVDGNLPVQGHISSFKGGAS